MPHIHSVFLYTRILKYIQDMVVDTHFDLDTHVPKHMPIRRDKLRYVLFMCVVHVLVFSLSIGR